MTMGNLRVGQLIYTFADGDCAIALAHAIGCAFVELQQLEFSIISYLDVLSGGAVNDASSFDLYAAKTFGNLLREMRKHNILVALADELAATKERRDFFIHKFLFHRYGGEMFTTEADYEVLVRDAHDLATQFANARTKFGAVMLQDAPVVMFGAKFDGDSGELIFVDSEFAKRRAKPDVREPD